ncbi:Uncharacterized protein OBRU01_22330 [Operophtera brumata]|uniref:Uncharacterized protein n=1 Tax=Operophtera brumata TaxID=104452 RepID=A0A0L7KRJ3_OPEBR|nr:Uncharacterized protein OBRU01_22330 [Operophtera brumata]
MQQLKSKWFISDNNLRNIRIVFHFVAFLHLVITAIVTLSIDTTVDEDPRIQAYYYLLALAYLPARLYADWKTKRGEGIQCHVKILNHATDVLMTSLRTLLVAALSALCVARGGRDRSTAHSTAKAEHYEEARHAYVSICADLHLCDLLQFVER